MSRGWQREGEGGRERSGTGRRGTHGLSEGLRGGGGWDLHARLFPGGDAFPTEPGVF